MARKTLNALVCFCLTALLVSLFLIVACGSVATEAPSEELRVVSLAQPLPGHPAHHVEGGFRNTDPNFQRASGWTRWNFVVRRLLAASITPRTFDAPRIVNDGAALRSGLVNPSITWVGHATLLVQLDGINFLTDPNWGERASPISWAGPRRLSPPGLAFENLPQIDVVVISHDHYDHLDLGTVKRLAEKHNPLFLVPLGLKAWFTDNGMSRVEELDWWQEREYRGLRFVCVPAQHFSQRTLWDGNTRLWATWAVLGRERRFISPQRKRSRPSSISMRAPCLASTGAPSIWRKSRWTSHPGGCLPRPVATASPPSTPGSSKSGKRAGGKNPALRIGARLKQL